MVTINGTFQNFYRMVAHLPKAHDCIVVRRGPEVALLVTGTEGGVGKLTVLYLLKSRQRALDYHLAVFGHRETQILVRLDSSQHKGPQHLCVCVCVCVCVFACACVRASVRTLRNIKSRSISLTHTHSLTQLYLSLPLPPCACVLLET